MADLPNPYANPYLPEFVSQRPRMNDVKPQVPQLSIATQSYSQIQSVNGFEGARAYAVNSLAPGASSIIAEADMNIARIYIVAKDSNGNTIVEGYRLTHEDEPKPITMEDINSKLSELLTRIDKLEEDKYAKSGPESVWKNDRQPNTAPAANRQNGVRAPQSSGSAPANAPK